MVLICINTMCTCTWYPGPRPSLESRQPKLAKVFVSEFDVWDLVPLFVPILSWLDLTAKLLLLAKH